MRKTLLITIALAPFLTGLWAQAGRMSLARGTSSFDNDESSGVPYLGVNTRDVTSDRLAALKLKEERGVEVTMVDQDAPAGKAGLKEHDVILSFNGEQVASAAQLRRMIHETPPSRAVTLGLSREGQPLTVKVQLAARPKSFAFIDGKPFKFEMPPVNIPPIEIPEIDIPSMDVVVHSSTRGGLMVENITPQLGEYFGVKNGQGVLVRSVEKGSAAERAGFRAGDVIIRVGSESVIDTSDWRRAMRSHKSGTVPVGIVREHKPQTLSFTAPRQTGKVSAFELEPPEVSASVDMRALRAELKRMRPEFERAQREAMANARKALGQTQEQMRLNLDIQEKAQRAVQQAEREMERQRKLHPDLEKEMQKHFDDAQRALEKAQQEMQKQRALHPDWDREFQQFRELYQDGLEM